jgi:2'-5' RNA ligase
MEKIRSFIAINLPVPLKDELAGLQKGWQTPGQNFIKWVDPLGIHLTLNFLGNIYPNQIAQLENAIAEAATAVTPFQLSLSDCGVFPNPRQPQVVWVGVRGDVDSLQKLQQAIDNNLSKRGFFTEKRPFQPHITLGRLHNNATREQAQDFGRLVSASKFKVGSQLKVTAVCLMKSLLTNKGAIYGQLASIPLTD